MLENLQNYGIYGVPLINNGTIRIKNTDINYETWDKHFMSIYNILRDGIELEEVHKMYIQVDFGNITVDLYIFDYWFNLIMWKLYAAIGQEIRPKHIFFDEYIRIGLIKKFVDNFLDEHITDYQNIILNNIIDDCIWEYSKVDTFSLYLGNSFDCESFLKLWKKYPETKQIMMTKMATEDNMVPIEDTMSIGNELTAKLLNYIKNSDHCLSDFVKAAQGLSHKQFKEVGVHVGPKPNGKGGAFPMIIDSNFFMGGVRKPVDYFIESSVGRIAQMIVKGNVGDAGYFANILKLNNIDTNIYPNREYDCGTKNLTRITIKTEEIGRRFIKCWFRYKEDGPEYLIKANTVPNLVGKTIYVRTSMTCASHAHGKGICYKCYGELAHTNIDICVGEIASEILSAQLTQKMLSAKHLLESAIIKMEWSAGFKEHFQVEYNTIKFSEDVDLDNMYIKIKLEDITSMSDEYEITDDYNEYINRFILIVDGAEYPIYTSTDDNLYLTRIMTVHIGKAQEDENGYVTIPAKTLEDVPMFLIELQNNELTKGLEMVRGLLNKNATFSRPDMDRHMILQLLVETCIECGMEISATHLAVILSNQLRNVDSELEKPDWSYPNEPYKMLTLNQSLTNHPSITIRMSYKDLSKVLFKPSSFKARKASSLDLFFMKNPQKVIEGRVDIEQAQLDKNGLYNPITFDKL